MEKNNCEICKAYKSLITSFGSDKNSVVKIINAYNNHNKEHN